MADGARCGTCGARIKPSDEWCSLCLTPVNPPTVGEPTPGASAAPATVAQPPASPPGTRMPEATRPPAQASAGNDSPPAPPGAIGPTAPAGGSAASQPTVPASQSAAEEVSQGEATSPEQLGALLEAQHSSRNGLADLFATPAVRWGVMLVGPLLIIALFLGLGALIG